MEEANNAQLENDPNLKRIVARATENAKLKNARLRHLKERNELYLAANRADIDNEVAIDDEFTKEL